MIESKVCLRCGKLLDISHFYPSKRIDKYPDGRFKICKECISEHVDVYDPSTFIFILREADVPYVPERWDAYIEKVIKDGNQPTGLSILGRYLSYMRLNDNKHFTYKDTSFLRKAQLLSNIRKALGD